MCLKPSILLTGLALIVSLSACANSPLGEQFERSLAADPRLQANGVEGTSDPSPTVSPTPVPVAQLPANFPAEIPRYPNAVLVAAREANSANGTLGTPVSTQTRWRTTDGATAVQTFYRERLQAEGWQIGAATETDATATGAEQPIQASRDGLQVTIATVGSLPNSGSPAGENPDANPATSPAAGQPTEFTIDYQLGTAAAGTPTPSASSGATELTDLNQAPTELQTYVVDLAKLGALPPQPGKPTATPPEFKPNAEISRRDYARWLVAANNAIYANQPARNIRLATASGQPAFQDVPTTDPDFGVIQGLANAGLIPSPLSGDSTIVTFRPDAPLTREELILWKVPVDTRQALPAASLDAVQQTWGFQDTAKIDPRALRAVLADFQNGDLSNIRRAFGYTTLFQPQKTVSRAEAAAVLWQFGSQGSSLSAKDAINLKAATAQPANTATEQQPTEQQPSGQQPTEQQPSGQSTEQPAGSSAGGASAR